MDKDIRATARVRVLIEIPVGSWSEDCKVSQVMDQASKQVSQTIHSMIGKIGGKIIGEPEVIATIGELNYKDKR